MSSLQRDEVGVVDDARETLRHMGLLNRSNERERRPARPCLAQVKPSTIRRRSSNRGSRSVFVGGMSVLNLVRPDRDRSEWIDVPKAAWNARQCQSRERTCRRIARPGSAMWQTSQTGSIVSVTPRFEANPRLQRDYERKASWLYCQRRCRLQRASRLNLVRLNPSSSRQAVFRRAAGCSPSSMLAHRRLSASGPRCRTP